MAYDAVRPMGLPGGDVQRRSILRRAAATLAVVSAVVAITMLVADGRQQVSAAGQLVRPVVELPSPPAAGQQDRARRAPAPAASQHWTCNSLCCSGNGAGCRAGAVELTFPPSDRLPGALGGHPVHDKG
jgi:hypothetical protein